MASDNLATRCPVCATVFRVVPDQLRVSDGWVRCGRCAEVFNAAERLVDIDPTAPSRTLDEAAPAAGDGAHAEARMAEADAAVARLPSSTAAASAADAPGLAPDLERPFSAMLNTPEPPGPAPDAPQALPDPRAEPDDRPSFMRRADRAARWRRPGVRLALALAATVAALALAAQIGYEYRDLAAAHWPAARPALEQACATLGCRVEAARAINALAVESSGLVRVEKSSLYKLSVSLRNRSAIEVALPAFDLSLTDSQGRLVARRVLRVAELGSAHTALASGRELALQATLQAPAPAGGEPVAGYTIELFYP